MHDIITFGHDNVAIIKFGEIMGYVMQRIPNMTGC